MYNMDIKRNPGRPSGPRVDWVTVNTRISPESKEWLNEQKKKGLVLSGVVDGLIQAEMSRKEIAR